DSADAQSFFRADESGRYEVYVSERGNERDFDYNLRLIVLPGTLSPRYGQDAFLEPGDRHTATLEFGRLSVVQFDAAAGATVFASLGKTSGYAEPQISIISPDGEFVFGTWDHTAVAGSFVAPDDGVYTAVIGDRGGDEWLPFTFSVASLPGEVDYSQPENTYLRSGERHESTVGIGQQHLIQFSAAAGSRVYASLGELSSQVAEPQIRILDPDGNAVPGTSTWDHYGLQVAFDATKDGLYTAIITDRGTNSPLDYTFSLAVLPAAIDYSLPENTLLKSGERHESSLGVGQQHLIQFTADEGSTVALALGDRASGNGAPQIRVVSPSGTVVPGTSTWDHYGLLDDFVASESGVYTAVISEYGSDNRLDYTFSVGVFPDAIDFGLSQNTLLANGETHEGSLKVGEQHLVQFDVAATGTTVVSLGETSDQNSEPQIWIVGPDGVYVASTYTWDHYGLRIGFQATTLGRYTAIIADRGANAPLDYRLRVASFPGGPEGMSNFEPTLEDGIAQAGALRTGEFAVHPFYLDGSSEALVSVQNTSGGSATASVAIYDSQGTSIASNWGYSGTSVRVSEVAAGWYYARVAERQSDQSMDYTVLATGVAAAVSPGDANGDGAVDLLDLDILGTNFGTAPASFQQGDFNFDGRVDLLDLDILGSRFGTSRSSVEPSSAIAFFSSADDDAGNVNESAERSVVGHQLAAIDASLLPYGDEVVEQHDERSSVRGRPVVRPSLATASESLDKAFALGW
ncbi:MAG: dockerin type I domain-containing protein, partial [Planctomycetota bacterium]